MTRFALLPRPAAIVVLLLTLIAIGACVRAAARPASAAERAARLTPRYRLTPTALEVMRENGAPPPALAALEPLVGTYFSSEAALRAALPPDLPAAAVEAAIASADQSDIDLYRDVVTAMRRGAGYYEALGDEFAAMGVRASSPFNWRLPTWAWLARWLTPAGARALLAGLVTIALGLWYAILRTRRGLPVALAGLVLLLGAFGWCVVDGGQLVTETWAGTLIAISLASYVLDRWPAGVAAGFLALAFRLLALPYGLLCLAIAACRRRWTEAGVWAAGIALWGSLWFLHARAAASHVAPAGVAATAGWLQLGGLRQAVATSRINVLLALLPAWAAGALLPLSILGLAGWRGWTGARLALTGAGYAFAFTLVGYAFNAYWGLLYAPVLAVGIAMSPAAIRDLIRAAARHSTGADVRIDPGGKFL